MMPRDTRPEPDVTVGVPGTAVELFALVQATQLVTSALDLETVLQRIVDMACELLRLPHSALLLREKDELVYTSTERNLPREWREALGHRLKLGDGIAGWVAAHRTPLAVADLLTDARVKRPDMARKYGIRSALAVPLQVMEDLLGVLIALDDRVRVFASNEVQLLSAFGNQAAITLQHAQMYEEARRHHSRSNAQLAESEAKYRGLLESASDAIIINQDRRYVYFNRAWVDLLGYSPEEIRAKDFVEFYAPAARAMIEERYARRLRGEPVPAQYEVQLQRKDGTRIDVEHHFSRIAYAGKPAIQVIVRDITERKRAEEEIRNLAQAVKSIGEGVAITNLQGRVLFLNREAERITGYRQEELQGQSIARVHSPNNPPAVRRALREASRAGGWQGEFLVRSKAGEDVPVHVTTAPVLDAAGRPASLISVGRNITEQKRLQDQLIQSERLQAVGQLASGVAHDFNNLLTIILGRAQLLTLHPEDQEAVRRGLKIIERAACDGAEVVRRVQQFTRRQREKAVSVVDVDAIISDAVEMTRPRWKEEFQARGVTVELMTRLTPGCQVDGHATELREVLINLILNALDAMPQGGTITITTETTERHVRLRVADTGVGMPPEAKRLAFEPFFTTKGPQSSGLGLSICYGIIRRHGGTIALESRVGLGTTLTMTLPRAHRRDTKADVPGVVAAEMDKGRVLVIDDEAAVAGVLAEILIAGGHDAEVTLSGEAGLEHLEEGSFDVVFTDLGMPGMNGYEVARRIKAARPTVPVVLVTGWGIQADDGRLKEHGVDHLVTKPFDAGNVLPLVRQLLRRIHKPTGTG